MKRATAILTSSVIALAVVAFLTWPAGGQSPRGGGYVAPYRSTDFTPPYDPSTRPWYLDIFWRHFLGRPYALNGRDGYVATQGPNVETTLASQAAVGAVSLVCTTGGVASCGFVVGETIVVGSTSGEMRTFHVTAISTDTISIFPKVDVAFAAGTALGHAWANDTHPGTTRAYAALAQKIASTKRVEVGVGPDVLAGVGLMGSTYTDANGETAVPTGWQSGNGGAAGTSAWAATGGASQITFLAVGWSNTAVPPAAHDSTGAYFTANTTIGNGMRTLTPIAVTPGKTYTLTWSEMTTAGSVAVYVVDASTPGTLVASTSGLGNSAATLGRHWGTLNSNGMTFRVPYGTPTVEIRVQGLGASTECYLAEMRLFEARQDASDSRYVIEDPGDRGILICGDSWSVPSSLGNALRYQLETRFGRSIRWYNTGVSGERLDQTNARFAADVKPRNPKYCIVVSFTNDVVQARSSAQMQSDVDTFIENCRSNGIIPIICGHPPISSSASSVLLSTSRTNNDDVRGRIDRFAPVAP